MGDACNGISSRCDLNPTWHPDYDCFGAVDTKVATWRRDRDDLSFFAVSSPTTDGVRPFSWSEQNISVDGCKPSQHVGHPNTFNFSWHALPGSWALEVPVETSEEATSGKISSLPLIWLGAASAGLGCVATLLGSLQRSRRPFGAFEQDSAAHYVSIVD
mmetsp:Transcript_96577/g.196236  ORF Transcript_96577/g.196236 Transcript_96577/m.196236 type:complete len:159 (-) Transcript_96577:195-671(-)